MRAERLDQFGEHRDTNEGVGGAGEASPVEVPYKEGLEEESTCEDESMCEDDGEDADDEKADEESKNPSSLGSMQGSPLFYLPLL